MWETYHWWISLNGTCLNLQTAQRNLLVHSALILVSAGMNLMTVNYFYDYDSQLKTF